MSLAKKKNENQLCSIHALNRRLQNAYSGMPITIDFTWAICQAWKHAGLEAFRKMAESVPTIEYFTWRFPNYEGPRPIETLVAEIHEPPGGRGYYAGGYYIRCIDGLDKQPRLWLAAAADVFARYRTYLISDEPPDHSDLENICRWECRIES